MKVFCVPGMRMVLAVKVLSSVSRDRKLWTGRSSWGAFAGGLVAGGG